MPALPTTAAPPSARSVESSTGADDPLMEVLSGDLLASGKWLRWIGSDPRLSGFLSLEAAVVPWRVHRDQRAYEIIGALTAIGSRRGADDDDAALAVVVLMREGIARLAFDLRDVCEIDDVRATVWEEAKLAEPQLGNAAAMYLLRRTRQRLLRPAAGLRSPRQAELSLEQELGLNADEYDHPVNRALEQLPPVEDPVADLADLLTWAREVGVVGQAEVDLLLEVVAASHQGAGREDAQRIVGERHGVAMRTIRRRRGAVIDKLRAAAPAYVAETV